MLLVFIVSNNLSNYGSGHFKLFSNCHVSWDTLYLLTPRSILNLEVNLTPERILYS